MLPSILICILCTALSFNSSAQIDLELQLQTDKTTLSEGETGQFTFILQNNGTEDAGETAVHLTEAENGYTIIENTISISENSVLSSNIWVVPSLAAGSSDTLVFEATSIVPYLRFLAEIISSADNTDSQPSNTARCISSDCFPPTNYHCFFQCDLEDDEVIFPQEPYQLEILSMDCATDLGSGCNLKYDIWIKNESAILSAPSAMIISPYVFRFSSFHGFDPRMGEVIAVPAIAPLDSILLSVDFQGTCQESDFFDSRTPTAIISESIELLNSYINAASSPTDLEEFGAVTQTANYCYIEKPTDIEVKLESNDLSIDENNQVSYQIVVTNLGDETPEDFYVTYANLGFWGGLNNEEEIINRTTNYEESFFFENDFSRCYNNHAEQYWRIRNLVPGETAILDVTLEIQLPFIETYNLNAELNPSNYLEDTFSQNNFASLTFNRANTDLELSVKSNPSDIGQYESGIFTYTLENKGTSDATGVEVTLYYGEDVVTVGEIEPTTGTGSYATIPDADFGNIGLWQDISVPAGGTTTLEIGLFSLVSDLSFCAEVTAADQEDIDSTPSMQVCTTGEDDEALFNATIGPSCSFFRNYPNAFNGNNPNAIELIETDLEYRLQAQLSDTEQTLVLDKEGNLLAREMTTLEPTPTTTVETIDSLFYLLQIDENGDTLINEVIEADYTNPTAVVVSGHVRTVSNGFVFGGFIVDTNSGDTQFSAYAVKTDLNGQNAQFILIEELDNTFGLSDLVESPTGEIFIFWSTPGNFSLSGINADFSSAWVQQFAADTPSTSVADIEVSLDGSTVYVAFTDNLIGEIIAYDATTGAISPASISLFDVLPPPTFTRMNGILPLANGHLLFANTFFGPGGTDSGFSYGMVDPNGQLVWFYTVEGEALELQPLATTNDGGFLFARQSNDLSLLKINALGEQEPPCDTFLPDQEIDLELSMSSNLNEVPIYTSATVTLTLVNNGPDAATNVEVLMPIDTSQFVEVGGSIVAVSAGNYFGGVWDGIELDAGDTATLQLEIFSLTEDLQIFAQVTDADQADVDSAPYNALCCTANEDDEAVLSLGDNLIPPFEENSFRKKGIVLFPNPVATTLNISGLYSEKVNYCIFNHLGQRVQTGFMTKNRIEVNELSKGMYYLEIAGEKPMPFVKL